MKNLLNRRLIKLAMAFLLIAQHAIASPPGKVEIFDVQTWQKFTVATNEPAIVVFSATYCVHCPAVIQKLAKDKLRYGKNVKLVAVVMDGDTGIRTKSPYVLTDRVFIFEGNEQAIRYSVNPDWRGVTPYTVLLAPGKAPKYISGPPAEKDLLALSAK